MRRAALVASLTALVAAAPAAAQTVPLAAGVAACETGPKAADRAAAFTASMPRRGAATMAMRFDLFERVPGSRFERVALPHWGVWQRTAKPGAPGFIFTKRVERLAAPARFRAVVRFRWYDAAGEVVGRARRATSVCRQPDWRPDLRVMRVFFPDGPDGPVKAIVGNRGRGAAGSFAVHAARPGLIRAVEIDGVRARGKAGAMITLGRCRPGEPVTITVDPADAVQEADESNNDATLPCPS